MSRTKLVLAPPESVDPPNSPVWTTDNMVAIQPPEFRANQFLTPYDFGAVGDGVADDTVSLQAWLDAIADGCGYGAPGIFMFSSTLYINSNTTIWGAGKKQCVFRSKQGVPQDFPWLLNKNLINAPDLAVDENIFIYGIQFCGDPVGTSAFQYVIQFAGVNHLILRDCLFQHHRKGLILYSNLFDYTIDNCEFTDWGDDTPPLNPGEWAGGAAIFGYTESFDGSIINNHVHDAQGQGIYMITPTTPPAPVNSPAKCVCANNLMVNLVENGLVGAPMGTTITGNVIISVTRADVSGHGMELHGPHVTVGSNFVQFCAACCIIYSNPVNVTIVGNIMDLPSQDPIDPGDPAPALAVNTQGVGSGENLPPFENISIHGNVMSSGDSLGGAPIQFGNTNGNAYKLNAVQCYGNNYGQGLFPAGSGGRWQAFPDLVQFVPNPAAVIGEEFVWGNSMPLPFTTTFTIASGISGTHVVTGLPFRPSRIEFRAAINQNAVMSCCTGYADINSSEIAQSWATDGTIAMSAQASVTNGCVYLLNPNSGTPFLHAFIDGVDDVIEGGFTLTLVGTTTTYTSTITAICFP